MNIYINGRFLEYKLTGVVRYSLSVLKEIDKFLSLEKYKLFNVYMLVPINISCPIKFKNIKIKNVGRNHGSLWEQIDLLYYAKDGCLLSLASTGPILKREQIIVLHDAKMARKWKSDAYFAQRKFLTFMGIILGQRLKRIITISEYAKRELNKYFYIPKNKIIVGYEGYEHILSVKEDENTLKNYHLKNKKFILAVGGGSAKKNLFTANALQKIDNKEVLLVITGDIPYKVRQQLFNKRNVIIVGRVTDEELVSLYKHAICLCFPSVAEGFGIPPIEAMALGCPVIVSDRDSLPEVCGNAALYCNPDELYSLVRQLNYLINNKELSSELINKGKENIKRFSWNKTAQIIFKEWTSLIKRGDCYEKDFS